MGQDYALHFDGNGDYVLITDHSELDFTENYTLEAWIFPESFSWLAGIISKYHTNASHGYILRLTYQSPYNGISFDEAVTNTGVLNPVQWYHVAGVNEFGNRTLYINGSEVPLTGSPLNVAQNSDPVRIGSDFGDRFFEGRIDEIRIWNTSRSQSDITANMDTTLSGTEIGLVAYYTFNEGGGDTLFDQTENGHHGVLMGNPSWGDGYTLSGLLGDINFDETLNIYDAVMLVAIMLGFEDGANLQVHACDTNQDGIIDIADIVLLVQWILDIDGNFRDPLRQGVYFIHNRSVVIESDGEIAGFQIELSNPIAIEEISLPSGWAWNQSGVKFVAYSIDGSSLSNGFTVPLHEPGLITNIKIAGWGGETIQAQQVPMPQSFGLQIHPNPFNPGCNISFELVAAKNIELDVYNVKGQHLQSIMIGLRQAGYQQFYWTPSDFSSGTYLIRLSDGENFQFKKILYLK